MKRISLKLLISTFFFVAILFLGLKSASAIDTSDPGYYGYKSRKVVTEALQKHTEIPEEKRSAVIGMLSKDGYFWFKTKQAKLNYIHAKLPTSKYLTIVADAENIHSWTIKPLTSKEIPHKMSVDEYKYYVELPRDQKIKEIVKKGEQGSLKTRTEWTQKIEYTVIEGLEFQLHGWVAQNSLKSNRGTYIEIAKLINNMKTRLSKGPSRNMGSYYVSIYNYRPPNSPIWAEATGERHTMNITTSAMNTWVVWKTDEIRVITHEFGHGVEQIAMPEINTPGYFKGADNITMAENLTNLFNAFIDARGSKFSIWRLIVEQLALRDDEYASSNQTEYFAEVFRAYMTKPIKFKNAPNDMTKVMDTVPSVNKEEYKKMINVVKFEYEYMATRVDGADPKFHPFTHGPISRVYSTNEILNGSFLK